MHWYLVHTKPRQEECALENLQNQGFLCYLPTLPVEKLRRGTVEITNAPLFPRYLFVQLGQDASARGWGPIRSTKGVNRLVSFGAEPARVDDGLIDALKTQESAAKSQPQRLFEPGDRVLLTGVAFRDIEGIFQTAGGERRAMVLIELLSRHVRVEVSLGTLKRVS